MTNYIKYPRTFHLPFSEGITNDDKVLKSLDNFKNKRVIVTEKFDGENCIMYSNYIHARSIDSKHHYTRDCVKQFHASIKDKIPDNYIICGVNLYAKHSIHYTNLPSYFLGFSIWNANICLSWYETINMFKLLDIVHVNVLYDGIYDENILRSVWNDIKDKSEGYVVRISNEFNNNVCKFVRKDHIQVTDYHWMYGNTKIEKNLLSS